MGSYRLNVVAQAHRPLAHYHPDIWGDHFFHYTPPDEVTQCKWKEEAEELKEVVRKELLDGAMDPTHLLQYVDAIHRFGLAYHFEQEIQHIFQRLHNNEINSYDSHLHYVALRFRLLRQNGFFVSSDVLEKFKDENGSFKESLGSDIQGILNLYEASYLRIPGEFILDEALAFATTHLTSIVTQSDNPLSEHIARSLELPLHKRSIRVESRYQISFYESNPCHDKNLLRFAKLDFNLLQVAHKLELQDFMRWSNRLDTTIKLPDFTRNRVVECYFWSLGAYHEPNYAFARMCTSKMLRIISIIDDIYDAYATTKELEAFTYAIQRWDKSCTNQLPNYMQLFYEAMIDAFEEIEQELAKEGRTYAAYYARKTLTNTCEGYFEEAKWRYEKRVPTYEEYIKNGVFSAGYLFIVAAAYVGMGHVANKDAFEWLNPQSKAPKASCIITRLLDDIAGHKVEQEREHVASSVETYMKQFGVSEKEAYEKIESRIEEAWKDINEEILRPNSVPMPLLTRLINLSRLLNDFLKLGQDGYTMPKYSRPKVAAVLLHPLPLD